MLLDDGKITLRKKGATNICRSAYSPKRSWSTQITQETLVTMIMLGQV